jgi:hypothetical protein
LVTDRGYWPTPKAVRSFLNSESVFFAIEGSDDLLILIHPHLLAEMVGLTVFLFRIPARVAES